MAKWERIKQKQRTEISFEQAHKNLREIIWNNISDSIKAAAKARTQSMLNKTS